jgi:hypothetical protein
MKILNLKYILFRKLECLMKEQRYYNKRHLELSVCRGVQLNAPIEN